MAPREESVMSRSRNPTSRYASSTSTCWMDPFEPLYYRSHWCESSHGNYFTLRPAIARRASCLQLSLCIPGGSEGSAANPGRSAKQVCTARGVPLEPGQQRNWNDPPKVGSYDLVEEYCGRGTSHWHIKGAFQFVFNLPYPYWPQCLKGAILAQHRSTMQIVMQLVNPVTLHPDLANKRRLSLRTPSCQTLMGRPELLWRRWCMTRDRSKWVCLRAMRPSNKKPWRNSWQHTQRWTSLKQSSLRMSCWLLWQETKEAIIIIFSRNCMAESSFSQLCRE